jgi:UDP:flavonoid glycosyltransferase YjiC (YdhE family)
VWNVDAPAHVWTGMRVLFTTTGSAGHLGPLMPFADAIRRAGGEVLVATRESSAEQARAAGYAVWPFAEAPQDQRRAAMASLSELPVEDANARALEVFGGMDARAALPGVLDACAAWRPDVMISEPSEFAGRVAGPHLALPTVTVSITQYAVEHRYRQGTEEVLGRLRTDHRLNRSDAAVANFTLLPPLLEDQAMPGPPGMLRFREPDASAPAPLPDWWDGADDPLVYVSFGSVVPQSDTFFPALYRSAIDALAPLPVRVLVTIGRDREPAQLGALPANAHVERWVPQPSVMPHAAAMVCHGGTGTVRAALAAGIPVAVLPMFADQPYNAERVAELGAGIALGPGPEAMAAAVSALVADAGYADKAALVADDIRALPSVDRAAALVRELSTKTPHPRG